MSVVVSLRGGLAHLAAMAAAMPAAEERAMTLACALVRDEARQAIGHTEGGAGPFDAWPPLAAATQAQRVREGFAPDAPLLRDGSLRDSIRMVVTRSAGVIEGIVGSASEIAVYQELGTARIPPRSFLGVAAVQVADAVVAALGRGVVDGLSDHRTRMNRRGEPSA